MLNKWECGARDCKSTAVGSGGALGLRAIGWWFESGEPTFCPLHRPDKTEKRAAAILCGVAGPCAHCKGDLEADKIQFLIAQYLELMGEDLAFHKKYAERWDAAEDHRSEQR